MIVTTTVSAEVNLVEIYEICKPIDRKKCARAIRTFTKVQLELRASMDNGWQYPCSKLIARELINSGYAIDINA